MPEKKKDWWDKLEIIGKGVAVPVSICLIGLAANHQVSRMNARMATANRDVEVISRFQNLYYPKDADSRRLSVHYIKLLDDRNMRQVLRQFILWDVLEKNVKNNFLFDSESADWHLFGDTLYDMAQEDRARVQECWLGVKNTASRRWPQSEKELRRLYQWIEDTYIGSADPPQPTTVASK